MIAVLRALTQDKGKSHHVKRDPQLTPNKSIKVSWRERETNPACPLLFFFFEGQYSKIGNLEALWKDILVK